MTTKEKTVTDHLHDALAALGTDMPAPSALEAARESIEAALRTIQIARCDAMAALDRF